MEKLGIAKEDLLDELKSDYQEVKEKMTGLDKTASAQTAEYLNKLASIKAKIDEVEKGGM